MRAQDAFDLNPAFAEFANREGGAKNPKGQLRRQFDSKAILPYNRFSLGGRMTLLTITAKGQVTLKRDLLKHLGVSPGEKIEADKLPDGRIVVRAVEQDGAITDFLGCLAERRGPKLTIDEMNEIARQAWAKGK